MTNLIFKSCLIIDGSGAEPYISDLRVSQGKVQEIGNIPPNPEARVIDGTGLALAPGFIDAHGHSDYHLLVLPNGESKLLQGITTEVGGNCGYSAVPFLGELAKERRIGLKKEYGLKIDFRAFSEYLEKLKEKGIGFNFAPLVGYNTVRACLIGYRREAPGTKEMKRIQREIEKAMAEGAFGMSAGLIYPPGSYATKEELISALEPVREADGIFACHIRSEGERLLEAISELIEIGTKAKVRVELSHLKTSGAENWDKLDKAFELIENAQKQGLDIKADRYPYTASFTILSSVLPDWVFEGGREAYLENLKKERERIKKEMSNKPYDYWDRIIVSQCFSKKAKEVEGKSISELAKKTGMNSIDFVLDFLSEEEISPNAIYNSMSEINMERIFQKDWVMVGSDSGARGSSGILAKGKPHPRVSGTFPKFISELVRKKNLLSLAKAIEKSSWLCAGHFGIKNRGKIEKGYYGDLVLFDPLRIEDRASFENPFLAPVGIEMVLVNGEIVVERNRLTGLTRGEVLKRKQ